MITRDTEAPGDTQAYPGLNSPADSTTRQEPSHPEGSQSIEASPTSGSSSPTNSDSALLKHSAEVERPDSAHPNRVNPDSADPDSADLDESADQTATELLATSFAELIADENLVQVLNRLKIVTPTEIQSRALPILIDGKDAILQAQTGSGKTLAFVLPLITRIKQLEQSQGGVGNWSSLMITPTRELALQIESVIRSIDASLSPACLIGGADMQAQIRALKQDSRIIVGTPGRILDLMRQKELKLRSCRFFVVDEVDELLSTGFLEDVRHILSRLPDKRQGVFVSATVTPRVEMLAHSFLSKPARIIAGSEEPTVQHCYCEVGADLLAKTSALCDLVETYRPRSAIVFCNTKSDTQLVEALLRRRGFDARRINSDLTQRQRNRIMKLIRDQELQLLIATDVAARGIDIAQLDLVVNYAVHDQPETYVHRTGRTGRAGRSGRAISLIGPRDFGAFHHLTKVLSNIRFEKLPIPGDTDVADARLTHLYELLRLQEIEVKERDILVARQLLREQGGIESASETLEAIVAKLCRSAIEHSLGLEAKGLDEEEIPSEELEQRPRRERESGKEKDRDGRKGRDRGDRKETKGEATDSRREDRRGRENHRRDRHDADDERRPENDINPERKADGGRRTEQYSDSGPRSSRSDQNSRQVRIYIGQGIKHGMNSEIFSSLAADFAEVTPDKILASRFREIYGFIDVTNESAQPLIDSLNGIEYNGHLLPVEIALVKEPRERPFQRSFRRGEGSGPRSGRDDRRSGRGRRTRE